MVSDRKTRDEDEKKKKRKRSISPSPSRYEERRDKSDKKKKKHLSPKEKKSGEKHRGKHRKHDHHLKLKIQELSSDDYFSKNNEFATWLKEEKNRFFSDLSSESARDLFLQFVEEWNSEKLESRYYEGIATGPRTSHKWKIK